MRPEEIVSLERCYWRRKPRSNWAARWAAAVKAVKGEGVVMNEVGLMLAKRSSPVWKALSKGVGGFRDSCGNGEPPFAFNSGLRLVQRNERGEESEGYRRIYFSKPINLKIEIKV